MGSLIEELTFGDCSVSYEECKDARGKSYFSAHIHHTLQGQFIIDDRDFERLKERIRSEIIPFLEVRPLNNSHCTS